MDTCVDPFHFIQEVFDYRIREVIAPKGPRDGEGCSLELGLKLNNRRLASSSAHTADLLVPAFTQRLKKGFGQQTEVELSVVVDELCKSQSVPGGNTTFTNYVKDCRLTATGHLTLTLHRGTVTKDVICNIVTRQHQYGAADKPRSTACGGEKQQDNRLVIVGDAVLRDCEDSDIDLGQLRTVVTAMHINKLLQHQRTQMDVMHIGLGPSTSKLAEKLELLSLFNRSFSRNEPPSPAEFNKIMSVMESKVRSCTCKKTVSSEGSPDYCQTTAEETSFLSSAESQNTECEHRTSQAHVLVQDAEECLKDTRSKIFSVQLSRTILQNLTSLELSASHVHPKVKSPVLVHVVNCRKLCMSQTEGLTWQLTSDNPIAGSQVFMSLGLVSVHNNCQIVDKHIGLKELLSIREKQLHEAYCLKYGSQVSGSGWSKSIQAIAIATIKIQMLAAAQNTTIKVDISDTSQVFRQATFVMYNCARLAKLFQHFEDNVLQGLYTPLPPIDQVDFTLLRDEDEWSLLLRYVMMYPSVAADSLQQRTTNPHGSSVMLQTNRICTFLLSLSHEFSSYYGRVHVLGEPRKHLFPVMFARLYLMKAIEQVIHSCLALLEIQPLMQM